MDIIDFIIEKLSIEDQSLIRERSLVDLDDHMGVSLLLRNLIYEYEKKYASDRAAFREEFSTIHFMWKGEADENYLLEKLWRHLNNIQFNDFDRQELRKIIDGNHYDCIDESVRLKLIDYINRLKK